MMTLIAAALAAAAPAAQSAPAGTQHQHSSGHHGEHQPGQAGHEQHKAMACCDESKGKKDCCKDMADATKAKPCCAHHSGAEHKHQ